MTDPVPPPAPPRRTSALAWLLLFIALPIAVALGWRAWQSEADQRRAADAQDAGRTDALEQRVATLREGQQALGQRLRQAESTNRLLRDELLAMNQRAALIEDSVQRLGGPGDDAVRALRLDEIELLLALGQQRLLLAGDLAGARSAHALAQRLVDALPAPGDIDLRQALAQERAALDALGEDPKLAAIARIDAFEAGLDAAGEAAVASDAPVAIAADGAPGAAWWERLADRIVTVRRSDDVGVADPAARTAGLAALRLELALARSAAERRDREGHAEALARASAWLPRLWPASPARDARQRELEAIAGLPLAPTLPELGSTLEQLRVLRDRAAGSAPDAAG